MRDRGTQLTDPPPLVTRLRLLSARRREGRVLIQVGVGRAGSGQAGRQAGQAGVGIEKQLNGFAEAAERRGHGSR